MMSSIVSFIASSEESVGAFLTIRGRRRPNCGIAASLL
jgi:hypothetical protein